MALSSCFFNSQLSASFRIDHRTRLPSCNTMSSQIKTLSLESTKIGIFGQPVVWEALKNPIFVAGSRLIRTKESGRNTLSQKNSAISASWITSSQIATGAFTWGTVAVLPFYTFMVVAPQAELTKKIVASSIPYVVLGVLYAYLLYLSWTPDTFRLMFASKYWLPELPGIAKMFSSEMTLASAWIHLLAVDLFAARQVYFDGLQDKVETRHSVSLCLLFCPVGILSHFITKAVATSREKQEQHGIH